MKSAKSGVAKVRRSIVVSLATALTMAIMVGSSDAQSKSSEFVPFQKFIASTASASSGDYMSQPDSRVKDPGAFEEMRRYILTMYQGVLVEHSMVEDSDYFDCVPVAQQPSVRLLGITQVEPPPAELPPGLDSADQAQPAPDGDASAAYDSFGNSLVCEQNTVPMRRLTLDELTHYATLGDFLGRGHEPAQQGEGSLPPAAGDRRYATKFQHVDNFGAVSEISLWDPPLASQNVEFSLAQQWISGGTGDSLQTIEGGWTKAPRLFEKSQHSVLFIYFTSKNYEKGSGCYNLECPGFVQEDKSWKLAGDFPKYSVSGGEQHWFSMEWYFTKGKNWWLLLKRDDENVWKWVGYYPAKTFNDGQMSKNADEIEFGGEVYPGSDTWPFMGSGAYPEAGWTKAAYQSNIKYTDTERKAQAATLAVNKQSANCYKVGTPAVQNANKWGTYFFFGGPGGKECK